MISLQEDEKILMEVRKHWLTIVLHGIALFCIALFPLLVVPIIVPYIFPGVVADMGDRLLQSMYLFIGSAWLWFVWTMFFVMWTNYYLDVLVVTNKRLIDMEQFVLFSRDEVMIPLEQIEDSKIEVKGLIPTLLRFGDLQIQTAGAARETMTKRITKPQKVLACIQDAVEQRKKST